MPATDRHWFPFLKRLGLILAATCLAASASAQDADPQLPAGLHELLFPGIDCSRLMLLRTESGNGLSAAEAIPADTEVCQEYSASFARLSPATLSPDDYREAWLKTAEPLCRAVLAGRQNDDNHLWECAFNFPTGKQPLLQGLYAMLISGDASGIQKASGICANLPLHANGSIGGSEPFFKLVSSLAPGEDWEGIKQALLLNGFTEIGTSVMASTVFLIRVDSDDFRWAGSLWEASVQMSASGSKQLCMKVTLGP